MKHIRSKRWLAALLSAAMVLSLGWTTAAAVDATYTFDAAELTAAADKEAMSGESFAGGYITTFGELTKRTGSDGAVKSVEVGKNGQSGFAFTIAGTAQVKVEFSSTGGSNTSTVGLWNDNGELVPSVEGITAVEGTGKTAVSYAALAAGAYKVVSPDASEHNRGARVYTISITETTDGERSPRQDWSTVAAPAVTAAESKDGKVEVRYTMDVGYDGADSVKVQLLDAAGAVVDTADGDAGVAVFTPAASGKYTVSVTASRGEEADKTTVYDGVVDYVKPLAAPVISSATSTGNGGVNVVWEAVDEATGYNVYVDGADKCANKAPVTGLEYEVTGLKVGSSHTFTVAAVRGEEEGAASKAQEAVATKEAQQAWSFATFGTSTKPEKNYAEGDLNRDGKVSVISTDGAGKILANSTDGLAFYYTTVPTDKNFTLRASVHVNGWENRSSQNGFGLAALDRVGSGAKDFWNNSVLVGGMRYAYYYDKTTDTVYAEADPNHVGDKYNMRLGIASLARFGVTHEGLDAMGGSVTAPPEFTTETFPMERTAVDAGKANGTYNLVANGTALECDSLDGARADYVLEVQKNNTGYFTSYYDADGKLIGRHKTYEPDALAQLDSENIYVGFFTSRAMDATFSDVTLKVNDPKDDPKAEQKPKTQRMPNLLIYSADRANSENYDLIVTANVAGKVEVKLEGKSVAKADIKTPDQRADITVKLQPGENKLTAVFTPDAKQSFADPNVELGSTQAVTVEHTVQYETGYAGRKYLYVSPSGKGSGDYFWPMSITTAVDVAAPGQTIILKEGTYRLSGVLNIKKGMSGTQEAPICMIADPNAATKPVLDFGGNKGGIELDGDWWYIQGIGVTGANGEGVNIAGSHNTLDQVDVYYNLATGIQISRSSRADYNIDYWPSYNLVLNCTAYGNADPGYSDADGFGAKLTCGVGNVFDGCIAHHNADDGWDLYAKAEQGPIGKVVVQNCVAYENGILEDGTIAGDGNGFKLGGESITAYHELRNSFSFNNKNCGITCNSCPDVQLFDNTAYNNWKNNINLYTKLAKNTDFSAQGTLSFKDSADSAVRENLDTFEPTGSQDKSKYTGPSNYYWDTTKTVNSAGAVVTADAFVSLDFQGVSRNADGTIYMGDYLKKSDKAPADAGATVAGTPSKVFAPVALTEAVTDVDGESVKTVTWPDGESVKLVTAAGGDRRLVTALADGRVQTQIELPAAPSTETLGFADVPAGHWAYGDIVNVAALGLVKGVNAEGSLYAPTVPVTRASLAQLLYRLSQGQSGLGADFADVAADGWAYDAVAWCAQQGVVQGVPGNGQMLFWPDDSITREQLATMLRRYAATLGMDVTADAAALEGCADADSVGAWAKTGVAWAVGQGIITGKSGGVLDPQGTASRAECAVMLSRFIALIK